MSVLARQVYSELRRALAPQMRAMGLTRIEGSRLGWAKTLGADWAVIHFWVDKSGWMPSIGSSFVLDFDVNPAPYSSNSRYTVRYYDLLQPHELREVDALNERVLSTWPTLSGDDEESVQARRLQDVIRETLKHRSKKPPLGVRDAWMHYYGLEDVGAWAEFLKPRIQRMTKEYLSRVSASES